MTMYSPDHPSQIGKKLPEADSTAAMVNRITRSVAASAGYTEPVKFTETNRYGCGPDDEDDVYTVDEFRERCASGSFVDYDGHGHPVKDGLSDGSVFIYPSRLDDIPKDATHIVWFNR